MKTSTPEDIIRELKPNAQSITPLEEGVMNRVLLVDDEVFRFPREEDGKQVLLYEAEILGRLAGKMTVTIPNLIEISPDGTYTLLSYVKGKMLSSEEIMAFNSDQKKVLAKSIIKCLQEINAALSKEEIKQLIEKYIPWQKPEDDFYESLLGSHTNSKYYQLYSSCYERYAQRQKEVGKAEDIVVHGDFHYGNMLFNENGELAGLIDFGDVNIGTAVTELRQMYRLGQDLVQDMITEAGNKFGMIDLEMVKLLAIVHEVWVLMRSEGKEPPKDGRDQLAKQLLNQWIGKNWGEL